MKPMNCNKAIVWMLSLAVTPLMLFIYNYSGVTSLSYQKYTITSQNISHKFMLLNDDTEETTTTSNNKPVRPQTDPPRKFQNSTTAADLLQPNCMDLRTKKPYPTSGSHIKGQSLCVSFQGTTRTDCVYNHPSVFNFILFSDNADQSVLHFREYLSIYSIHKFYKPDKVVIHCNHEIQTNNYWKMLKKLSTPLETKHIERIHTIGKSGKKPGYITHEADYFKVGHALKNGGIYADFDMVVLNGTKLREMQRRSEIIFGRDNNECTTTCAGFISCVPGSPLVRKWLDSYENDYQPNSWLHNAGQVPSNTLRSCSECYDAIVDMDISNWNEAPNWGKNGAINWQKKPVAHYHNAGFMKPLKPVKEILKMSTSFAEMVKHVLGDTVKDFEDLV